MFGIVKSRLCKYLLKRLFGRYIGDDLDAIKVVVEGDTFTLRNVRLELSVGHARADFVSVQIPWRSLTYDGCSITLSGLDIDIVEVAHNEAVEETVSDDPFLHRALSRLIAGNETDANITDDGNEDAGETSHESVDMVADYILEIVNRTQVHVTDTRVRLDDTFLLAIPMIRYANGSVVLDHGFQLHGGDAILLETLDYARATLSDDGVVKIDVGRVMGCVPSSLLQIPLGRNVTLDGVEHESAVNVTEIHLHIASVNVTAQHFTADITDIDARVLKRPQLMLQSLSVADLHISDDSPVISFTSAAPAIHYADNRVTVAPFKLAFSTATVRHARDLFHSGLPQVRTGGGGAAHPVIGHVYMPGPVSLQYTSAVDIALDGPVEVAITGNEIQVKALLRCVTVRHIPTGLMLAEIADADVSARLRYRSHPPPAPVKLPMQTRPPYRVWQTSDDTAADFDKGAHLRYQRDYTAASRIDVAITVGNVACLNVETALRCMLFRKGSFTCSSNLQWCATLNVKRFEASDGIHALAMDEGISVWVAPTLANVTIPVFRLQSCRSGTLVTTAPTSVLPALEILIDPVTFVVNASSIVATVGDPLFDLISRLTEYKVTDAAERSDRCATFHVNLDDCELQIVQAQSLVLVSERIRLFRSANADADVTMCCLSLHLLDDVRDVTMDTSGTSSPLERVTNAGYVTIATLDVAEIISRYRSQMSIDIGNVTLMACADSLTCASRALSALVEMMSRPGNVTSPERSLRVLQHDSEELARAASATLNAIEPLCDDQLTLPASLYDIDYEYHASPSVIPLPNPGCNETGWHADFSVIDQHFGGVAFTDASIEENEMGHSAEEAAPMFSVTLSAARVVCRLFAKCDFEHAERIPSPPIPIFLTQENQDEQGLCRFLEARPSPPTHFHQLPRNGGHRATSDLIEIVLGGVRASCRSWDGDAASSSSTAQLRHRLHVILRTIEVEDCVRASVFKMMIAVPAAPHSLQEALVLKCESLTPSSPAFFAEHRTHVVLAPVDLALDGATLEFLAQFAAAADSVVETVVATPLDDDTLQLQACLEPSVYVHLFEWDPTTVNVTYRPARVDLCPIRNMSDCLRLLQLLPLSDARFDLQRVMLRGVAGYSRVASETVQTWAADIAHNQYDRYLRGIVPFRSVVQLGVGVRDLVFAPRPYARDPARAFRKVGVEAVTLAMAALSGAEIVLEGVESLCADDARPPRRRPAEPRTFMDGLRQAMATLSYGVRRTSDSIVGVPLQHWRQHNHVKDALRSAVRGAPRVLLEPTLAATKAVQVTLCGLRNTIDAEPQSAHRSTDHYAN